MYRRLNNSRYMVAGISGIVIVMSIFTWLMFGIANRIDQLTLTMMQMGEDVHTMTEIQKVMVNDIGRMTNNVGNIQTSVHTMSRNMAVMTGSTAHINANMARLSQDMGRTSHMFSSPMAYFWNMGQ